MSDIGRDIINVQAQLESRRGTWEQHWTEVARYILQRHDDFYDQRYPGEKRNEFLFDSIGPLALDRATSAIEGVVTPRSLRWHGLEPLDPRRRNDLEIQAKYERVVERMFRLRYSGSGNFAPEWYETLTSTLAFGTGIMTVDFVPGIGMKYKSHHLKEHYLMENQYGEIDTDYRKFKMSGKAALQFYGEDLSDKMRDLVERHPLDDFEFINCVRPNEEFVPGSFDPKKMAFISHHVEVQTGKVIRVGGFRTFPYIVSRYVKATNEVYGRGLGTMALPEIKMVNKMRQTDIRARSIAVAPPILTANEMAVRKFSMRENAFNFGMLDSSGNPMVRPWQNGERVDLSERAIEQSHRTINDAFFVTLFQILVENPQQTATEVLQRDQEKGALLAPAMGRIQSEALSRLINRELDLMALNDQFPDDIGDDFAYDVTYSAPINRLQKSEEALATQRTVEATIPIANIDPSVLDSFDWDEYTRIMADANGAPARLFFTREELEAKRRQKAEQQQMSQLVEAAPAMAGAVKDIAEAQNVG